MVVASACPDLAVLQQLSLGSLPPEEVERLAEHCEHCARCVQTMHSLKTQDTLVKALAAQATNPHGVRTPVVEALIARLKATPPAAPATADHTRTQTSPSPAALSAGTDRDVYDFLAAPQAPGELGRLGGYPVLKVLG